jgi:phospholipid/cholesterol/gamma-HCH transport system substrate-binding protein
VRWSLAPRLIALAAVVVLGFYYIGTDVLGLQVGDQPYVVTVMLPRAGGIYTEANVTYRGVPVGTVQNLDLSQSGVAVKLAIKRGVRIPADVSAHVRELSALGEQYMDLVPHGPGGPWLRGGSVIPEGRASVPVAVGSALNDLGTLVSGINPGDVTTLEKVLYPGFTNAGPDLRSIVVNGQALANALLRAAPASVELINDGNTVLQAAQVTAGDFTRFNAALAQLTGAFAAADSNLRAVFVNGAAAAQQIDPLLERDSASIEGLVGNLASAGKVSLAYQPAMQALFSVLPVVSGDLGAVGSNGSITGEVTLNTSGTVCPYVAASQQLAPFVTSSGASLENTCPITAPDLLQRGAQYAPVVP